jgi:phosphoglycolate phosphatase
MSLIVFDLDGTLIDSARDLADSTNEMLGTFGAPALPNQMVLSMVGEGAKKLVERAMAASGLDAAEPAALARFREIYDRRLLVHTRAYDGIPEVLEAAARRMPLAVLTNKPEAPTRRLLDGLQLAPFFRWVIGGDGAFPRKPDPASLRHLVEQAGVEAAQTIYVGDSNVDVETARRAGVPMCLARYGFGYLRGETGLDAADFVIEEPRELIEIIGTLSQSLNMKK